MQRLPVAESTSILHSGQILFALNLILLRVFLEYFDISLGVLASYLYKHACNVGCMDINELRDSV